MTLPEETEKLTDGALGLGGEPISDLWAVIGYTSGGAAANVVQGFSDPVDAKATLVDGPGLEDLLLLLKAKKGLILFVKPTTSVAGANSAVVSTGTTPPVWTIAGTPHDSYDFKARMGLGGALATATFFYSLDGGDTWSGEIATAASFPIPGTGLTITQAAGPYNANNTYAFTTTAPMFSTTDFGTAFDALMLDPRGFGILQVVGVPGGVDNAAKSTAMAGFAASVQTKLDDAFTTKHRFIRAFLDGADITDDSAGDTALATALVAVAASRVAYGGGFEELISPLTGRSDKRPSMWAIAARVRQIPIGTDPARVIDGDLSSGQVLAGLGVRALYHDENTRNTLDGLRLATLRTWTEGPTGYYVTNCPLLSPVGSDFKYIQHGRLIDEACRIARRVMLRMLSNGLRTYPNPAPSGKTPGTIFEQDARKMERNLSKALNGALVATNQCQLAEGEINRTDILTGIGGTGKPRVKVRVRPFFYPKSLELEIGFEA